MTQPSLTTARNASALARLAGLLGFAAAILGGCYGGADPIASTAQAIASCPTTHRLSVSTFTCEYTLQSANPVGHVEDAPDGGINCRIECECGFAHSGAAPSCGSGTAAEGDYPATCAPFTSPVPAGTGWYSPRVHTREEVERLCAATAEQAHAQCVRLCGRRAAQLAGVDPSTEDAVVRRAADLFCCLPRTTSTTTRTDGEAAPSAELSETSATVDEPTADLLAPAVAAGEGE